MKNYIAIFYYSYETDVWLFDDLEELCVLTCLDLLELKYEYDHKNFIIYKIDKEVNFNEII